MYLSVFLALFLCFFLGRFFLWYSYFFSNNCFKALRTWTISQTSRIIPSQPVYGNRFSYHICGWRIATGHPLWRFWGHDLGRTFRIWRTKVQKGTPQQYEQKIVGEIFEEVKANETEIRKETNRRPLSTFLFFMCGEAFDKQGRWYLFIYFPYLIYFLILSISSFFFGFLSFSYVEDFFFYCILWSNL